MNLFTIAGHFARYRSLADKTLQLTFETREPDPETVSKIQQNLLMPGFVVFKPDEFRKMEIDEIEKLKIEYDDSKKSQSWRIRAILYKLWEQKPSGFDSFEGFYNHHTEKYIEHIKSKLI